MYLQKWLTSQIQLLIAKESVSKNRLSALTSMYSMASVDDMMQSSAYPLNRLNPIEVEQIDPIASPGPEYVIFSISIVGY